MPTFLFLLIWVAMFRDRDAEANSSTRENLELRRGTITDDKFKHRWVWRKSSGEGSDIYRNGERSWRIRVPARHDPWPNETMARPK